MNRHGMLELVINTTDVYLLGSQSSYDRTKEVSNKFQIRLNRRKIAKDAYLTCLSKDTCKNNVLVSDSTILNSAYKDAYKTIANTAMTNEQWQIAQAKAE